MFCTKCGKQIPDSTKFCPYCGANCSPEQDIAGQAGQVFNKVEKELGSAFDEVKQSFNRQVFFRIYHIANIRNFSVTGLTIFFFIPALTHF